jgi:metal-dependent HD superfamily phosphatase/phosphodiesterase
MCEHTRHGKREVMRMKSAKEQAIDHVLMRKLTGRVRDAAEKLIADREIQVLQDYANVVSIRRLGYNDHGPVHMKTVAINAMIMTGLLHQAGVKLSLETEELATFEDCQVAVLLAAYLHDLGMTVARDGHEWMGVIHALPIIQRLLSGLYPESPEKQVILRALITEAIVGHMATQKIHSLEAGLILVADGCDMKKGRARIPLLLHAESRVGDIHKYSAASIEDVTITRGEKRPIKIVVHMDAQVGIFQVEQVLLQKIQASPIKSLIELHAQVKDEEIKAYL